MTRRTVWYVVICFGLMAATLAVYGQVYRFDFVSFDDPAFVRDNPQVRAGLTLDGLWWACTTGSTANWHPLTWLSYMLVCQLFGPSAGIQHLANVLLHVVNGVLLFVIFERMTGVLWRSAFVAALFALHPLHVESVAWVAERKDVLSTCFAFLTVWAYLRYVAVPRRGRYWLVGAALVLGLLSKPMLVTLPFVLLLLDIWPLRRVALFADGSERASPARVSAVVREKLPFFALVTIMGVVTAVTQIRSGAVPSASALPFARRAANALIAYVRYMGKAVWPRSLTCFYPYDSYLPWWEVVGAAALLAGLTLLALRAARDRPYVSVGWFWYVGTLVPVIGLVQVGDQALADRYTYMPLIGLFIIVAWGVPEALQPLRTRSRVLIMSALALIAALMIVTWRQVGYWRDSLTLYRHAVEVTSESAFAHHSLAVALDERGMIDAAIGQYEQALRIDDTRAVSHNRLGVLLARTGDRPAAVAHYTEALRLQPDYAIAHNNLGVEWHVQGLLDRAASEFRSALRYDSDFAMAYDNLGLVLGQQGNADDAVIAFKAAIRHKLDSAGVYLHLGIGLEMQGQSRDAIAAYRAALARHPDWPEAANKLAWLLATHPQAELREPSEAVRLAELACAPWAQPLPEYFNTLAAAYAAAGRFTDAMQAAQRGIDGARAAGKPVLADEMAQHLHQYELGQPYRQPAPDA